MNCAEKGYIYQYYESICTGKTVVGKWIRAIYDYVVKSLNAGTLFYNEGKAEKAIAFVEGHCYHTEGVMAPGNLRLELWQKAFLSCVFGLVDKDGLRQFREVLLVIGRKNGKSLFAAAIAKYILYEDGGFGSRTYCIAPKLEQADIIYNSVWQMIQLDPEWIAAKEAIEASKDMHNKKQADDSMIARHTMTDLRIPGLNSTVKKIAFSSKKSDGFNPSLTICDEISSWEGDSGIKQYEVLKSGMGARPEGLMLSCTTSGYVSDGIYDELMKRATRFLLGESEEKRMLPFLYIVDDPQKWDDMNELRKSNPNLGVSVTESYLEEEIAIAKGSLSKKAEFLVKYCCVKQNSSLAWLDAEAVAKAGGAALNLQDFRECYCVCGVDLSRTTDLTAVTCVIEKQGELYCFAHFFLPAEKIEEATARDNLPYEIYIKRGLMSASGDNIIDYHDVYNWLTRLIEEYQIYPLVVGYDRYSAAYLIQDLNAYGFKTDDVYQGENLSPVIREFEGLIKDGKVHIGDNDLLKVHLLNSAVKLNAETERMKLIKISANQHIDGMAALLDAFCVRQKWFDELGTQLINEE